MAEQIRQYNQNYELQLKQYNESVRQFDKEYNQRIAEYKEQIRQFDVEIERLKAKDKQEYDLEIKKLAQQKAALEQEQDQWEDEMKYKRETLAEQQRQFDEQNKQNQAQLTGSSGGTAKVTSSSKVTSTGKATSTINATSAGKDQSGAGKVTTDYFNGKVPQVTEQDAKRFGTFANGYQPMGINGYGKVKKTGDTIPVNTTTLSGQKRTINQNIWETPDGTLWYWEGRYMIYKKLETTGSGGGGGGGLTHKAVK